MRKIYPKKIKNKVILSFPLNYGNLKDAVSGGSVVSNSYCTWNSTLNCYVFSQHEQSFYTSLVSYASGLNLPFISPYTPNFTREYDIYPISSQYGNIYVLGHSDVISQGNRAYFSTVFTLSDQNSSYYLSIGNWHHIKETFFKDSYKLEVDNVPKVNGIISDLINDSNLSHDKVLFSCSVYNNGAKGARFGLKNIIYKEVIP